MKPYLIRPQIESDESLYGHLLRSAAANLVSPLRVSHRLQLMHPYQLKPANHATFVAEPLIENYHLRFKVDQKTIQSKLAVKACSEKTAWHGLLFHSSWIRSTPRICPICQQTTPNLIKDQWYIDPYMFCHKHKYELTTHEHSQIPLALYSGDVISELNLALDAIFSSPHTLKKQVNETQALINKLPLLRPKLESSNKTKLPSLWPMKQFKLFSNVNPGNFFS